MVEQTHIWNFVYAKCFNNIMFDVFSSSEDLTNILSQTKSMPQSQSPSASSSIADITARAEILQETLEPNALFSNSTVSLNSMGMNDNVFVNEQFSASKAEVEGERWKSTATFGGILRTSNETEPLKRRISLQEKVEFSEESKS